MIIVLAPLSQVVSHQFLMRYLFLLGVSLCVQLGPDVHVILDNYIIIVHKNVNIHKEYMGTLYVHIIDIHAVQNSQGIYKSEENILK